jgi:hypothetical protein
MSHNVAASSLVFIMNLKIFSITPIIVLLIVELPYDSTYETNGLC